MRALFICLVLIFSITAFNSFSQPINDNCANALEISVDQDCSGNLFSTEGATQEPGDVVSNPTCGAYQGADVWFHFQVPTTGNFRIEANAQSQGNVRWALYQGVCGDFIQVHCAGSNTNVNFIEPDFADETMYLRVWRHNSNQVLEFSLCFIETTPPSNNNCATPIGLPVTAECQWQQFTNLHATAEHDSIASNPCGLYQGGDVWFTFDVPASGDFRIEIESLSPGTAYWTLYSGTCGDFEQLHCSSGKVNFSEPDWGSSTMYLRVHRYYSAQMIDFTLCIFEINPPSNDNCANPIGLPVTTGCQYQQFTNLHATAEHDSIASNPCGLYQGGDVWFTFDAPASGDFRIEIESLSPGTAFWTLYSGTCGEFEQLHCSSGKVNFSEPTWGSSTMYLRVHRYYSAQMIDFALCIFEIDPPVNNDCANPITLGVSSFCEPQYFSTWYATSQPDAAANPSCGLYQGNDVWFNFVVPSSGEFRIETTNESGGNLYWALYSGDCGSFTEISCSGSDRNFSLSEYAGDTLALRMYRYYNTQGMDFGVCLYEIEIPENNNCEQAFALEVGDNCQMQTFSNKYTTSSALGVAPNPSCGFYQGGDLWFKFEVPSTGNFRIERNNISGVNAQWAVYEGTCGNFSQIGCGQLINQQNFGSPELSGDTVYLRVYNYNNLNGGTFELCVWEAPQPINDYCANAIELPVNYECQMELFTNAYAPANEPMANPTCGFYQGGDVWFKFVVPQSGEFQILRNNIEGVNAQWAVYQGTCGDFEQVDCAQLTNQVNFNHPELAGDTLYLRVYNYNSPQGGEFEICIRNLEVPANDMCNNAIQLPVDTVAIFQEFNNYNATAESGVAPTPSCGFYQGGDVWFSFVVPQSGEFQILRNNIEGVNAQWAVYQGACGDFEEIGCAQLTNQLNFHEVELAGDTLYIRVYGYNNPQGGIFEISVREGNLPTNDLCVDAIELPVESEVNFQQFTSVNATSNNEAAPYPSCGSYQGGDTWFKFVVPTSGKFLIQRNNLGTENIWYSLYDGSCGNFTEIACPVSPEYAAFDEPSWSGDTIFLRTFRINSPLGGEFELSVIDTDCNGDFEGSAFFDNCSFCVGGNTGILPCEQDCNGDWGGTAFIDTCDDCVGGGTGLGACTSDCGNPQALVSAVYPNTNWSTGSLSNAASSGLPICEGAIGPDVYYSFSVPTENHYWITVNPFGGADIVIEVLNDCGGTILACANDAGDAGQEQAFLQNLLPGDYLIRIHNVSGEPEQASNGNFLINVQSFPVAQVQANPANFMYACNATDRQLEEIVGASPQTGQMPSIMDYEWEIHRIGGGFSNTWQRGGPNYATKLTWLGMEYGETYNVYVRVLIDVAGVGPVWGVHQVLGGLNPEDAGASTCTIATSSSVTQTEVRPQYTPTNLQGNAYAMCNVAVAFSVADAENYEWEFNDGINPPVYYERGVGNPSVKLSWVNCLKPNTTYQVRVRANVDGQWGVFGNAQPMAMAPTANTALRANMCGTTRGLFQWLLPNPVCIADSYEYRLTNTVTGDVHTSLSTVLSGGVKLDSFSPELVPGAEYVVEVKATQCGEEGDYSSTCNITIAGPQAQGDETPAVRTMAGNSATLYPNPNAGTEVRVELSGLGDGNHEVMIQIYDVYGKLIQTEGFGHAGSDMSRLVRFDGNLAMGMYMVQFVVDGERFTTEPLVVK